MKTVKEEYKMNPEIIAQAEKLFQLIEDEIRNVNEDRFAETMAEEYGEKLKSSRGFSMLEYAHAISQTESEQATMCLEEAFYHMDDKAARSLTEFCSRALHLGKYWKNHKSNLDSEDLHHINFDINTVTRHAEEIYSEIGGLWMYRAESYRDELEKLKRKAV